MCVSAQESKQLRLKAIVLFRKLGKVVTIFKKHFFKGEVRKAWVPLLLPRRPGPQPQHSSCNSHPPSDLKDHTFPPEREWSFGSTGSVTSRSCFLQSPAGTVHYRRLGECPFQVTREEALWETCVSSFCLALPAVTLCPILLSP